MRCNQPACVCTHDNGCDAGYMERAMPRTMPRFDDDGKPLFDDKGDRVLAVYEVWMPCPTCYPEKARIVATSVDGVEMSQRLRELGRLMRDAVA